MTSRALFGLAIAGVIFSVAPASGKDEPETLKRSASWVVDYNKTGCHLFAQFGEGDDQVTARFTRDHPGSRFDFSLYGKRFHGAAQRSEASLDFGLGQLRSGTVLSGSAGKIPALFMRSLRLDSKEGREIPDEDLVSPEQESAVTNVTVKFGAGAPLRLEFGSLGKPFAMLRHCTDILVESWGYDPTQQATLKRRAMPATAPADWIKDDDYPDSMLRQGASGLVRFQLDVGADGKVEGCRILAETEPSEFGRVTCKLIRKHARFEPALDAAGISVRSYFVGSAAWLV